MANGEEKRILREKALEDLHSAAVRVCEYMTDGDNLKEALFKCNMRSRDFFEQKRLHLDVKKAFSDAEEARAELKMAELDELSDDFLASSPLNKDTYSAVTNNLKWSISKLLPNKYGSRPSIEQMTVMQNNLNVISNLSDEKLIAFINGESIQSLDESEKEVDTDYQVVYDSKCDNTNLLLCPKKESDVIGAPDLLPVTHQKPVGGDPVKEEVKRGGLNSIYDMLGIPPANKEERGE